MHPRNEQGGAVLERPRVDESGMDPMEPPPAVLERRRGDVVGNLFLGEGMLLRGEWDDGAAPLRGDRGERGALDGCVLPRGVVRGVRGDRGELDVREELEELKVVVELDELLNTLFADVE